MDVMLILYSLVIWSGVATGQLYEIESITGYIEDVRLAGGQNNYSGRVELGILLQTLTYGTICDDAWDDMDASIICKMLGYRNGGTAVGRAYFGQGEGPIFFDNVLCDGREMHIRECWAGHSQNCDHNEDAGVVCNPSENSKFPTLPPKVPKIIDPNCSVQNPDTDYNVSLLSYGDSISNISSAGIVQIYLEDTYYSICDDYFDLVTARVFCRDMCFDNDEQVSVGVPADVFGPPKFSIAPFTFQCEGHEQRLKECIKGYDQRNFWCSSAEAAAVSCTVLPSLPQIFPTCSLDVDYRGTVWHHTRVNVTAMSTCPLAYGGMALRKCSSNATWEEPHYNQCVKRKIQNIVHKLKFPYSITADRLLTIVRHMSYATDIHEVDLTSGDIKAVVSSFPAVVRLDNQTKAGINVTEAFISVVSNVMAESTRREWMSIQEQKDSRLVVTLLDAVTDAGFLAADKVSIDSDPLVVVTDNLVFEAGRVTSQDIIFPKEKQINVDGSSDNEENLDCRNAVSVNVRKASLENIYSPTGVHPYTAVLYNTLTYLLVEHDAENVTNVPVSTTLPSVSVHIESRETILLDPPLEVIFRACVARRSRLRPSPSHRVKRDATTDDSLTETETVIVPPPLHCVRMREEG